MTDPAAADARPADLESLLDEVNTRIEDVEQDLRLGRVPVVDAARALYRLRARMDDVLTTHGNHVVERELRTEAEHLRRALDEFDFTTTAASDGVHIVEPWSFPDDGRTLCGEQTWTATSSRPEGAVCASCAVAFTERMFPRRRPPADRPREAR